MVNGPQFEVLARRHLVQRGLTLQPVLAQLGVHQPQGQPGTVDRNVDFLQQVGQGSHMVFVTVGEQYAQHPLTVLDHVGEIGQHEVDAQHLVVGEH